MVWVNVDMRSQKHLLEYENYFPDVSFSDIVLLHNGQEQCWPGKVNGPYISDHYLFHLILGGRGVLLLDNCRYSLGKGQGFFIAPGQLYQYSASVEEPWEYLWFGFRGDSIRTLMYNSRLLHTYPIYESPDWKTLAGYMQSSIQAVRDESAGALAYCHGLLFLLIAHLIAQTPLFEETRDVTQQSHIQMHYIYSAIEYVRDNLSNRFTASDVSDALGLNRSYFSRLFTQLCGISPSRFINNYRLDAAWHMLRHSDTPIAKIAQAVGLPDASYFTHRFRARYGLSPSEIRLEGNRASGSALEQK